MQKHIQGDRQCNIHSIGVIEVFTHTSSHRIFPELMEEIIESSPWGYVRLLWSGQISSEDYDGHRPVEKSVINSKACRAVEPELKR